MTSYAHYLLYSFHSYKLFIHIHKSSSVALMVNLPVASFNVFVILNQAMPPTHLEFGGD